MFQNSLLDPFSTPRRKEGASRGENDLPAPPKTPGRRHTPRPILMDRVNGTPKVRLSSVLGPTLKNTLIPSQGTPGRTGERKSGFHVHRDEPEQKALAKFKLDTLEIEAEPEDIEYAPPPRLPLPYDPGFGLDDPSDRDEPPSPIGSIQGPPSPLPLDEGLLDPPSPILSSPESPLKSDQTSVLYQRILPVAALHTRAIPPSRGLRMSPGSKLPLPLRLIPSRQQRRRRLSTRGNTRSGSSSTVSTKARRRIGSSSFDFRGDKGPHPRR
ncbi:hypothetical protein BJ684DRAFT_16407 [Piptocephalis cylindrospora]|uniref:Uncharacterized protein n=1 Tax=Piptocephalis cylindrospora TaxID=1907219 RepID=A0A4P9Y3F4_9FUNG|nr:hypothetical protein BJ684DRAFT_16407 [Piptocephalis cylindrospora]|eukprot:RKP13162.1 hypothetical protein BJ684DRAFT_16407 [Piptocephalis cylindrospora]